MNCRICGIELEDLTSKLCKKCDLTLFQILDIIEIYVKEKNPPEWLTNAVQELAWIYQAYPRTAGYFNTAVEILEIFTIFGASEIPLKEIKEVNYTSLPTNKVLSFLEEALLIERDNEVIRPGKLTKKLQEIRWEGYKMDSPEMEKKILEIHGILTVALTKSLIQTGFYIPRGALAIFDMLSHHILTSGKKIDPILSNYSIDLATIKLPIRQRLRLIRTMSGFVNGKTKIISDNTEKGEKPLKPVIIKYLEKEFERYRERERERERELL